MKCRLCEQECVEFDDGMCRWCWDMNDRVRKTPELAVKVLRSLSPPGVGAEFVKRTWNIKSSVGKEYWVVGYDKDGYVIVQSLEPPYRLSLWTLRDSDAEVETLEIEEVAYEKCDCELGGSN